ncbi:hypothetical protein CEUSTIGMA_g7516.t1 [Chlamydomonas eustigma]|uniref:Uncharacterized protein n=1 Tax=Chlamydomonas eustigma TaxID=1157962 RepID=A0A250XAH3_9CHLO|nr:hypothetical protein CEUSTIGMA_g7516.t1 [Chlamydomonas eustigma]|eukprot:GAX80078.1 hypothetical protein CEUSTIGMA_g7516.t1 [Chlamydomonas eustigma]
MWFIPEVTGVSPSPRGGIACTAINSTKLIVFGGSDREPSTYDDVWVLETAGQRLEWIRVTPSFHQGCKVYPRSGATLTAIHDKIFLYGGQEPLSEQRFSDLKCLDINTWTWSDVQVQGTVPPARHSHAAGCLAQQCLVIYGGSGEQGTLSDVWIFNVEQSAWSHASSSGAAPLGREMHSGCMINETSMLVYGGRGADGKILCDAAVLDVSKMKWGDVEPTPFSRCAHTGITVPSYTVDSGEASTSDAATSSVLIYGGFSGDAVEGDVLRIDCKTLEIEQVRRGPRESDMPGTVPQPRFAHAAASISWSSGTPTQQAMIILGGVNPNEDLMDVALWVPDREISTIIE